MKRNIIKIDKDKCNGCGTCIPDCPEGALQIIDGKAHLISDLFCDGFGACLKACPRDAMLVETREAVPYNEYQAMENIIKGGYNVIKAHLKHLKEHGELQLLAKAIEILHAKDVSISTLEEAKLPCGCPGALQKDLRSVKEVAHTAVSPLTHSGLNNWPIQLTLINPNASYLHKANLVIAADCTAFAYHKFQNEFLQNKILIMFCPKLDMHNDAYIEKLSNIFTNQEINSIRLVHMEVPCCGDMKIIVQQALIKAHKQVTVTNYVVSINGKLT